MCSVSPSLTALSRRAVNIAFVLRVRSSNGLDPRGWKTTSSPETTPLP
ncbi:hypothetical protein ACIOC1_16870 [Streptomyces sp. NPDC088197]